MQEGQTWIIIMATVLYAEKDSTLYREGRYFLQRRTLHNFVLQLRAEGLPVAGSTVSNCGPKSPQR